MWQTITTAIVLFIGVLLGASLTVRGRKDGFEMLLEAIQKLKDGDKELFNKEPQIARCLTCGATFEDVTWEDALAELNHHIRTQHADKTNVVNFPEPKTQRRYCVVCDYVAKADVQSEADSELLQHMKTHHPEHLLGSEKPVREMPING